MNHIYKLVWSRVKHCYVVTSEIAKSYTKSAGRTSKVAAVLAVSALVFGMGTGYASTADVTAEVSKEGTVTVDTTADGGQKVTVKDVQQKSELEKAGIIPGNVNGADNSIALGSGSNAYKGNSTAIGNGAKSGKLGIAIGQDAGKASTGREGAITVGAQSDTKGLYSVVVGTKSHLTSDDNQKVFTKDVQGAAATVIGSFNDLSTKATEGKAFASVGNTIFGAGNKTEDSNGVIIQGVGNTVTNSYKNINLSILDALKIAGGDFSSLTDKETGSIAVIGGANTIDSSHVVSTIGFGNTITGSDGVFVVGQKNKLKNTKDSLIMGNDVSLDGIKGAISLGDKNEISGDNAILIGHENKVKGNNVVAIGQKNNVNNASGSIALGIGATVDLTNVKQSGSIGQWNGIAIGSWDTKVIDSANGIAIGASADATNSNNSIAIGEGSSASGVAETENSPISGVSQNNTAIGQNAGVEASSYSNSESSTALGYGATLKGSNSSIALGSGANITNGYQSIALGNMSTVEEGGFSGTALGAGSIVKGGIIGSVALGSNSIAMENDVISVGSSKADVKKYNAYVDEYNATMAKRYPGETDRLLKKIDENSVSDFSRRITNVADGDISVGSHDAVTGGQLAAAGIIPGDMVKDDKTGELYQKSVSIGENSHSYGDNNVALGDTAWANGANNTAVGQQSWATNGNATAIGQASHATGGTAIGVNTSASGEAVAIGGGKKAESTQANDYATAIGWGSEANAQYSVAIGHGSEIRSAGAGEGESPYSVTVGSDSYIYGKNSVAFGGKTQIGSKPGVGSTYPFHGKVDQATAIGNNSEVWSKNSVALGFGSVVGPDQENVVSVGNSDPNSKNAKITRRIINVDEGTADTDAATVGQLNKKADAADLDGFVAYDKKGTTINKDSVTFAGAETTVKGMTYNKGTALKQVSDISVQVPVYEMGPWGYDTSKLVGYESRSFANAGLVPGKLDGNRANKGNNVAIDDYSHIINAEQSIAIGSATVDMTNVKQTGAEGVGPWNGIAIGQFASVKDSHNGVAIGAYAESTDSPNGTSIGVGATIIKSRDGSAFGHNANVSNAEGGVAVGAGSKAESKGGIAVGLGSAVSGGENNIAVGANAKVLGGDSIAIGSNAKNGKKSSVALGNGSEVSNDYEVSIGNATLQRKIVNVADGNIAIGSHDAVTGGQLAASGIIGGKTSGAVDKNGNPSSLSIAIGYGSDAGTKYKNTVVGTNASTKGAAFATAIGHLASVYGGGNGSVALGAESAVQESDMNYPPIGATDKSQYDGNRGVVSVGKSGKDGFTRRIINVKAGVNANDAVNKAQLDAVSGDVSGLGKTIGTADFSKTYYAQGAENVTQAIYKVDSQVKTNADGVAANKSEIDAFHAAGIIAGTTKNDQNPGSYQLAIGKGSEVAAEKGTAIGSYAKVTGGAVESVALGSGSVAGWNDVLDADGKQDPRGVISVGKSGENGFTRRIVNVKDGIRDTDAATVGQLNRSVSEATKDAVRWDAGTNDTIHGVKLSDGNVYAASAQLGNVVLQNGKVIANNGAMLGAVTVDYDGKISGVKAGTEDSDAVNYKQLKEVSTAAGKHSIVKAGDKNVVVTDTETDGQHTYDVSLGKDITLEGTLTAANAALKGLSVEGNTILKNDSNSFIFNESGLIAQAGSKTNVTVKNDGVIVTAPTTQVNGNVSVMGTLKQNNVEVATKDDIKDVNQNVSNLSGKIDKVSDKVDALDKTVTNQGKDINELKKDTEQNTSDIAANKQQIDKNTSDIAANKTQIDKNTSNIAANKAQIDKNTSDIAANKQQIDKNTSDIAANKAQIDKNTADISKNTNAINKNTERIDVLEKSNSATNEQVKKNTDAIAKNAGAIAANADAIKQEVKNRENAVKDEALKRETEDKALSGRINANKTMIDKHTDQIGATGKDGALNLSNGANTIEKGINTNYDLIKQNSSDIQSLGVSVHQLGGEIDSVGAISSALAGLHPLDYDPTNSKYQLAAAVGGYDGSYALALGGFYNVNKDILLSGGVSTILKGQRKTAGNLGLTVRIGAGNEGADLGAPSDFKEANQQIAALKQDNKVLAGENRKLADKVDAQDEKLKELEAKLNELLAAKK